jgi:hypothetical protein
VLLDVARHPGNSEAPCRDAGQLRRVLPAGFDVPTAPRAVLPDTLPRGLSAAVGRLELTRLDHPEAPIRLRTERRDQVARLGHEVHGATVDEGGVRPRSDPCESWVGSAAPAPCRQTRFRRLPASAPAVAFE